MGFFDKMTDVVDSKTRSRMMSGIRGKNTKPEIIVRKLLHQNGFRFRLHVNKLPGKPDIVLPKYKAVIFVHGCFWHRHLCTLFKWPKTRPDFWKNKLDKNVLNDQKVIKKLRLLNWRVCIIWECSVKGANKDFVIISGKIGKWLKSEEYFLEIEG